MIITKIKTMMTDIELQCGQTRLESNSDHDSNMNTSSSSVQFIKDDFIFSQEPNIHFLTLLDTGIQTKLTLFLDMEHLRNVLSNDSSTVVVNTNVKHTWYPQ